jgi:hypothetical protein
MLKKLFFLLPLFSGFLFAQVPLPGEGQSRAPLSSEQRVLNYLADSLWKAEIFKKSCPGDQFKKENKFIVYDSTYHLPEPIMVYKFSKPSLSHEELIGLTERQIINFVGREKLDFDIFQSRKAHFTQFAKDFREGYYLVRISQPMLYEDHIYYDFWVKESPTLPGINVLFQTDLRGQVTGWEIYTVCTPREK